jgi:hypothetical protein
MRYHACGRKSRRCHPRELVQHALDLIDFEELPFELTADLLDSAADTYILEDGPGAARGSEFRGRLSTEPSAVVPTRDAPAGNRRTTDAAKLALSAIEAGFFRQSRG